MSDNRQIYLQGPLGQRHLREVLGALLAGAILAPEGLWLVSAWISDFPVLDNSSGRWNLLEPAWGHRLVSFAELLAKAIDEGCNLRIATRSDERCRRFVQSLQARLLRPEGLQVVIRDEIHIKGLLSKRFFLEGSMNFTFSGSNLNDEHIELTSEPQAIRHAFLQFRDHYFQEADL